MRRFVLLHKQLDPDDDEITRTRKVRRNVIADRYRDIIAALERGDDAVEVRSRITYQDGSSTERVLELDIFDLTTYSVPEGRGRRPVWSGRRREPSSTSWPTGWPTGRSWRWPPSASS